MATDAELDEAFYDHFTLSLTRLQVLLAGPKQDWMSAWSSGTSPLHILEPTSLELGLKKSLLPNDTRLPKYNYIHTSPFSSVAVIICLVSLSLSLTLCVCVCVCQYEGQGRVAGTDAEHI